MTLPPQPRVPAPPDLAAARGGRRCGLCGVPLASMGRRALRTAGGDGRPDGVLVLETAWCPNCGRVELFSTP